MSKVSLAIDCWASSNHLHFLAVIVYWIDDAWKFQEALLDVPPIHGKATGEKIGKAIFEVLETHHLHTRLLGLTSDNGSNLVRARDVLEGVLGDIGVTWEAKKFGVPCLAHVIQLGVTAFCESLNVLNSDDLEETLDRSSRMVRVSTTLSPANTIIKVSF